MQLNEILEIAKALSDEGRVRALLALRKKELCVCQIVELLGLAPSTVSKHLSILKHAGFVEFRKHGRWVYYRIEEDNLSEVVQAALDWASRAASLSSRIIEDEQRLDAILKLDPDVLCQIQQTRTQED